MSNFIDKFDTPLSIVAGLIGGTLLMICAHPILSGFHDSFQHFFNYGPFPHFL